MIKTKKILTQNHDLYEPMLGPTNEKNVQDEKKKWQLCKERSKETPARKYQQGQGI